MYHYEQLHFRLPISRTTHQLLSLFFFLFFLYTYICRTDPAAPHLVDSGRISNTLVQCLLRPRRTIDRIRGNLPGRPPNSQTAIQQRLVQLRLISERSTIVSCPFSTFRTSTELRLLLGGRLVLDRSMRQHPPVLTH